MQAFARLFQQLDETTRTSEKVAALRDYFCAASPADAGWVVAVLCGRRPKRVVKTAALQAWCAAEAGLPAWLFDESYEAVGDLAETISLLLPRSSTGTSEGLATWIQRLQSLAGLDADKQEQLVRRWWRELSPAECFLWNKLLLGGFRVGVSEKLVARALAEAADLPTNVIAHRLMGDWQPGPEFFQQLMAPTQDTVDPLQPYPFCLAHAWEGELAALGNPDEWLIEWKWDGIRAQLIRRGATRMLWSRGEEPVWQRFPELHADVQRIPRDVVLDGEILAWGPAGVRPFTDLQRRIGRKTVGRKLLADVPVRFLVFDVLECDGSDLRERPQSERRALLETLLPPLDAPASSPAPVAHEQTPSHLPASSIVHVPLLPATTWAEVAAVRDRSRSHGVEGLMLKRRSAPYGVGRVTGLWWKWKIAPATIDAVLLYAQRGHGRRAGLYTDYTFAVWQDGLLVPFAKAYSGLTDAEIREVDRFIKANTREQFGPVRSVTPQLVFELAFENIQPSTRHKSGVAVRFPRIARWRRDKTPEQADSLATIHTLLRDQWGTRSSPAPPGEEPAGEEPAN